MQNTNLKFDTELKKSINKFFNDCGFTPLCESCSYIDDECTIDCESNTSTEYYKKCLKLQEALKYFKKRFRKVTYLWWEQ